MGGKSARTKGHSFEREIVKKLRNLYPNAKRLLEYQGGMGYDLENTGPFLIQAKRFKSSVPMSKLYEVPEKEGYTPLLWSKVDREPELVTLRASDFLKIIDPSWRIDEFTGKWMRLTEKGFDVE